MNVITRNWRGLLVVTLGVATLLSTHYLLHSCADTGVFLTTMKGASVPMRCSWTERAVQGVGGLVALLGVLMVWLRESTRGLSLAVAASGLLMFLTPIWLIPTCDSPMMNCNLSLKPGAMLLGALITIAGLASAISVRRFGEAGRTA